MSRRIVVHSYGKDWVFGIVRMVLIMMWPRLFGSRFDALMILGELSLGELGCTHSSLRLVANVLTALLG